MSFANLAWAPPSRPAESLNSARQMPAVGDAAVTVRTTTGDAVESFSQLELFEGRVQFGFVGVLIVGLLVFYIWTHNVQGGG